MFLNNKLNWAFALIFLQLVTFSNGYLIQLYDSEGFEGLFFESGSTAECVNIPTFGHDKASSLKSDSCIIAYKDVNCPVSWSMKVPQGEYYNLNQFQRVTTKLDNAMKSFHVCNATNGGDKLNIDLKKGVAAAGETIVQYRDLCGCANIPLYATGQVASLDNYGNCLKLWSEIDCKGGSVEIVGGVGEDSNDLSTVRFTGLTKSVSGCRGAEECVRMNSTVFKFELSTNESKVASMANEDSLEMAAKTIFRNNGSATVTQEYEARKTMTEKVEISREKTMTSFTRVHTSSTVTTESKVGFLWFASSKITKTLTEAYTYENTEENKEGEKFTKEEKREFAASQRIDVPPCSTYSVSSYIRVMQNYPVDYAVYSYISGTKGMKVMGTVELKERLSDLTYVGDHDNQTIIAMASGTMLADFGVEARIDGEGELLLNCQHLSP